MASATAPGTIRVYAVSPDGKKYMTHSYRNGGAVSAGGSPSGVLANKTADKWVFFPLSNVVLSGGWKVQMTLEMEAADGLDASDAYIELPITFKGEGVRTLNATNLGYTVDIPAATAASIEVPIGSGYSIPDGKFAKIGGSVGVISIEDDTA